MVCCGLNLCVLIDLFHDEKRFLFSNLSTSSSDGLQSIKAVGDSLKAHMMLGLNCHFTLLEFDGLMSLGISFDVFVYGTKQL